MKTMFLSLFGLLICIQAISQPTVRGGSFAELPINSFINGQRILVYSDAANVFDSQGHILEGKRATFYYSPIFGLKPKGDGKLDIEELGNSRFRIKVIMDYRGDIGASVLYRLAATRIVSDPTLILINSLPIQSIIFSTADNSGVSFDAVDNNPIFNDVFNLEGSYSQGSDFISRFAAGKVTINAKVAFEGGEVIENNVFFKLSTTKFENFYSSLAPDAFVAKNHIAKALLNSFSNQQVVISSRFKEDPYLPTFVSEAIKKIGEAEVTIEGGWAELGNKATEFGIDPNDFKASLLKEIESSANGESLSDFKQSVKNTTSGGGGIDIVGLISLGGSGNSTEEREVISKTLQKYGVQSKQVGDIIVPSKITGATKRNLDLNNGTEFKYSSTFSGPTSTTIKAFRLAKVTGLHSDLISDQSIPIGTILPFAGERVPPNFMECNGESVSKTEFSELYTVIENLWGTSNDPMRFTLPDLRGYFVRGWLNKAVGIDPDIDKRSTGNRVGSIQGTILKDHSHNVIDPGHNHLLFTSVGNRGQAGNVVLETMSTGGNTAGRDYVSRGDALHESKTRISVTEINSEPASTETRPINRYVMYIIKVK